VMLFGEGLSNAKAHSHAEADESALAGDLLSN